MNKKGYFVGIFLLTVSMVAVVLFIFIVIPGIIHNFRNDICEEHGYLYREDGNFFITCYHRNYLLGKVEPGYARCCGKYIDHEFHKSDCEIFPLGLKQYRGSEGNST